MDVRLNSGINSTNIKGNHTLKNATSYSSFNIKDKLGSVTHPQWGYAKPIITTAKNETVTKSTETETINIEPTGIRGVRNLSSGAESIPGPSAAVISKQVQQLSDIGLQFLKKGFLSFFGGNKLSPKEAAGILTGSDNSEKSKLMVKTTNGDAIPINNGEDVRELAIFRGISNEQLTNADTADFLKYVEKTGIKFKSRGNEDIGGYGAYNFLDKGWPASGESAAPVELVRDGISIMTIDPKKTFDGKEAKEEFEKAWAAYDSLKKFDEKDYQKLSYLKTLNKPLYDFSFVQRFEHFDKMGKFCDTALLNYQEVSKKAANKAEFLDMINVLENQDQVIQQFEKYPEFNPDAVKIIMNGKGPEDATPRLKSEILRELRKPLSQGDYSYYKRDYVLSSFNMVNSSANSSGDLKKLSKMFVDMHNALHARMGFDSNNVGKEINRSSTAFRFIINNLGKDSAKTDAFNGILRCGKDVGECIEMYKIIEPPVKNEDFKVRAETAQVLAGTKNFEENFKTVMENHNPGENSIEWANLIKEMENTYGEDPQSARKLFVDAKDIALRNQGSADDCAKLVETLSSDSKLFREALTMLDKSIMGEGFRTRKDILVKLRSNHKMTDKVHKPIYKCDEDTLKDYKTISSNIARGEGLQTGAERFQILADELNGNQNSWQIRNLYIDLTKEIDKAGGRISRELLEELIDKTHIPLFSSGPIDRIEEKLNKNLKMNIREFMGDKSGDKKTIIDGERSVNIGGVQLEKNR